ncbi:hypothetical protein IWQ57_006191, partial [Coemansia nantahalensis]
MAYAASGFGSPAPSDATDRHTSSGAERSSLGGADGAQPVPARSPISPGAVAIDDYDDDDDNLSLSYRGVRGKGLGRRRGSLRSTFAAAEGLHINTNVGGVRIGTGSLSPSPHAGRYADPAPVATASPASTHASGAGSFRRAGSVLPAPPPASAAAAAAAEMKRNSSALGPEASPAAAARNRSLSYTPATRSPALQAAALDQPRAGSALRPQSDVLRAATIADEGSGAEEDTLFDCLLRTLDVATRIPGLDGVLADAAPMGRRNPNATAARVVDAVASTCDMGPVLPLVEYDRRLCEVAALRSKLQSTQTRLAMDVRARDTAKAQAGAQRPSGGGMFKGKHSHQALASEYSAACET